MRLPTINEVRLTTGLIIGAFVLCHLTNHALGIISIETADAWRPILLKVWFFLPVTVLLYLSLFTHAILGLRALYRRGSLRMPPGEAWQLALGLLIPTLLLAHAIPLRITGMATGVEMTYPRVVSEIWLADGFTRFLQAALVLIVWSHLCIGVNYSLKLRSWYPRAQPYLFALAILTPALALLGFFKMGQWVEARAAAEPGWFATQWAPVQFQDQTLGWIVANHVWLAPASFGGIVLIVLLARFARIAAERARGRVAIRYPGGKEVRVPRGLSILEASRSGALPHASFCGGRGRCTTCRVSVVSGEDHLPPPNAIEALALERLGTPERVRLACQTRPTGPCDVVPLIADSRAHIVGRGKGGVHGDERDVVVMFIDLRGSTTLAENRLPFDVVFILNQFFSEMTDAVEGHGGHYSNFTGDGLMALFGLEDGPKAGARGALASAFAMLRKLEDLNARLREELAEPLVIGIGIHVGSAVVGEMGPPKHPVLTALGDPVNTTARLESLTKDYGVPIIISEPAARVAELDMTGLPRHAANVKGRAEPVAFHTIPAPPPAPDAAA